ncbi:hypothetical protein FRC20_000529 [Serendipita sp. 405]|nr:hypothetical protein FRC20_000529 [Serendipita sp. 405]
MEHGRLKALFNTEENDNVVSQTFQRKPVDESKIVAFTQATARKSKKQKEEEAAEEKRRQHELEFSQVFEEYVADFSTAPRAKGSIGFVKAGEAPKGPKNRVSTAFDDDHEQTPEMELIAQKPKGKRAMDAFLEEIKRDQAARERRFGKQSTTHGSSVTSFAAYEAQSGSRDRGDPETSNLFVAHLPENVTEDKLGEYFGQCGEITSVKIMWPRGEGPGDLSRRSKASGLNGFVSFKRRRDAEAALREFDGVNWSGSALRVGWSKAVPTSGKVIYGRRNSRSRSPSPRQSNRSKRYHSRSRSRSLSSSEGYDHYRPRDVSRERKDRDSRYYQGHSRSRSRSRDRRRERRRRSRSSQRMEKDEEEFIKLVAGMTRAHGQAFEENLKVREKHNPNYQFLLSPNSAGGRFYEDLLNPERDSPYQFDDEGNDDAYSTDNEEIKEAERISRNRLGNFARKRFEVMLRAMSGKRGEVARSMAFCLEHAEAAPEVANVVISSLLVNETPVPRKIARLHLISDVIHNSAVSLPSAWKYRQEFQNRLGLVFDHLSTIYHSFGGRMTAETFKRQVVAVIAVWDDRIVFPPEQTSIWKDRLDGKEAVKEDTTRGVEKEQALPVFPTVSKFKSAFKPLTDPDGEQDMDLEDDSITASGDDDNNAVDPPEDIDGAPIQDEEIDGEVLEDIDGAPIDDIDGAPLDDNLDGEPLDFDGEPLE